jgi:hypothetical protein
MCYLYIIISFYIDLLNYCFNRISKKREAINWKYEKIKIFRPILFLSLNNFITRNSIILFKLKLIKMMYIISIFMLNIYQIEHVQK